MNLITNWLGAGGLQRRMRLRHSCSQTALVYISLFLFLLGFQLATIRPGMPPGDDSSLYLLHARNIASSRSYGDTGFIYTPDAAQYSPAAYPPIFPLLLAPVFRSSGLELKPYKVLMVTVLVLCLLVVAAVFQRRTTSLQLLLIVALVGLNPFITEFKNNVMSDLPFLLFLYLAILLFGDMNDERSTASWLLRSILAGFFSYLAYGTRSVGIVIIFSIVVFNLIRTRRPNRFAIASIAAFVAFAALQLMVIHSESDYLPFFFRVATLKGHSLVENLRFYAGTTSSFLYVSGSARFPRLVIFAIVSIIAVAGLWVQSRRPLDIFIVFCIGYAVFLLFWPTHQDRYLLPLVPAYFYYFVHGVAIVKDIVGVRWRSWGTMASTFVVTAIFAAYFGVYVAADFGPYPGGPDSPPSKEVFRFLRESTPADAIVIAATARAVALYAGRPAARFPDQLDEGFVRNYIERLGARYLLVARDDRDEWKVTAQRIAGVAVFSNSAYLLYDLSASFLGCRGDWLPEPMVSTSRRKRSSFIARSSDKRSMICSTRSRPRKLLPSLDSAMTADEGGF